MKTWEYKIINVRSENYSMDPRRAEELNRLGDDMHDHAREIEATLKRSAAALKEADVPFLLGGSLAFWAHGGPERRLRQNQAGQARCGQGGLRCPTSRPVSRARCRRWCGASSRPIPGR